MIINDIWIPTSSGDDTLDSTEYLNWWASHFGEASAQALVLFSVIICVLVLSIIIAVFCTLRRKKRPRLQSAEKGFPLQREPAVKKASRSDERRKLYWCTKVLAEPASKTKPAASKAKPESTEPPAYDSLVEPPRPAFTAKGRSFVGYMQDCEALAWPGREAWIREREKWALEA